MQTEIVEYVAYFDGPRWVRSDLAIKDECWRYRLECEVYRETTLLREHVRFKVSGERYKVEALKKALEKAVHEWNT